MKLKKIFTTLLSSLFLSTHAYAYNFSNQEFIDNYDQKLQNMLSNYKDSNNTSPLHTKIFDIGNPLFLNFLKNSTGHQYDKELLAMQFYKNFKVNNQPTNFCFILYDSKKSHKIKLYINSIFSNKDNAISYLVAHEFGHCITYHKKTMGLIQDLTPRQLELLADMFSISFFVSKKQFDVAELIVERMGQLPKEDIHNNFKELTYYYNQTKDTQFDDYSIDQIFQYAFNFYQTQLNNI